MKSTNTGESWRERCVRLIGLELGENEYLVINDLDDAVTLYDLQCMDYVRGVEIQNSVGTVVEFRTMGATLQGKLFAEEQQSILDESSVWGRIKKVFGVFGGWVMGILTALIIYKLTN